MSGSDHVDDRADNRRLTRSDALRVLHVFRTLDEGEERRLRAERRARALAAGLQEADKVSRERATAARAAAMANGASSAASSSASLSGNSGTQLGMPLSSTSSSGTSGSTGARQSSSQMAGSQFNPLTPRERELREIQQVERLRQKLEEGLKKATDREREIKSRAARLDTLEADKAALEGLDETCLSNPLKVLKNDMLSLHAHVDSRMDFMKSTLDQIVDALTKLGFRPPAQSSLPLTAMSGPFPVQVGTQPSGTSAAVSQTVASSSSGPAVIDASQQQPVPSQGQQQGQWYPKTPMKPPLAFSGERKDEELNTCLRTIPISVKAKRTLPKDEVVTAASYLEGKAAKWLDAVVVKAGYGRRMADWAKSLTLDQFMEMVEARWHNPQEAQRATDAINKLDQRKFKSVRELTTTVESLILVPGIDYSHQFLLTTFVRCFPENIRNLLASEARTVYHSFETLSRKALDLEATPGNAQPTSQSDSKKKKSPQEWKKGAKLIMVDSRDVTRGTPGAKPGWLKTLDIQLNDITAFVTDSAGVNVSAMQIFEEDETVKHIFWIRCVAHVMDLILEDIGSIGWVASRIAQARLVTKFFKRHSHAREALEKKTKLKLLLPAETRFGTNVIMIRRLLDLQTHLMQVVTEDPWRDTVWATRKVGQDAAEITTCVGSPPWWEDLRRLCNIMDPVMEMLQMLDSDTRQINKVLRRYEMMIASCLTACDSLTVTEQDEILEVFNRRRTMFRTPVHIAAMMLDPEFRDATLSDDDVMQQGLIAALVQFGYPEGSPQLIEVLTAIDKFHARERLFDNATTDRAMRSYEHPSSFWESKSRRFPHTAHFAMRILRVWTTASPCERAWSRWSFIHSKTRNRLEVGRAEKLVRCHWNLRLLDHPSLTEDAPHDRPDQFGKWVHYWQHLEDELPTDQQLVAGSGARLAATQEEMSVARERMHSVSRMGTERRLVQSDKRRRGRVRGRGGHGGRGGRSGRGRGGRGSAGGICPRSEQPGLRDEAMVDLIRFPRQHWDEGDFLYHSSDSDDEDFFCTAMPRGGEDDGKPNDDRPDDDDSDDGAGDGRDPRSLRRGGGTGGRGAVAPRDAARDGGGLDVVHGGGGSGGPQAEDTGAALERTRADVAMDAEQHAGVVVVDGGGSRDGQASPPHGSGYETRLSVSMDFMDTLVTSKSCKRHIFVIIYRFTKYARLIPMQETARTEYVIKLSKDNWVRDFGLPKTTISDRDVRFTSELWKKTAEQMGSQLQMTSGIIPKPTDKPNR
ncbi:hypothetical protein CBR_g48869 [Chara braunii]|uniref:Integrase catalytic domain-containing protein n=1 Tax=Chara braunii TaxID=69332 RepID=A0A388M3U7_CHABU|nr:hypothetical protein CBR_g48869 [Chara braunii]|eukprot:GBG89162.1 hypothetical protein CBR_g48869 [Chara braunii]